MTDCQIYSVMANITGLIFSWARLYLLVYCRRYNICYMDFPLSFFCLISDHVKVCPGKWFGQQMSATTVRIAQICTSGNTVRLFNCSTALDLRECRFLLLYKGKFCKPKVCVSEKRSVGN